MENKVVFCCRDLATLANHNDLVFIFPQESGDLLGHSHYLFALPFPVAPGVDHHLL
jgi:hypothetical protein